MKYLLLIVVVGVVLWLMGSGRRQRMQQEQRSSARRAASAPVEMVACARCGLNLPRGEALQDGDARPYCSEAHRAAGPR